MHSGRTWLMRVTVPRRVASLPARAVGKECLVHTITPACMISVRASGLLHLLLALLLGAAAAALLPLHLLLLLAAAGAAHNSHTYAAGLELPHVHL